jgi:hypothetical protein
MLFSQTHLVISSCFYSLIICFKYFNSGVYYVVEDHSLLGSKMCFYDFLTEKVVELIGSYITVICMQYLSKLKYTDHNLKSFLFAIYAWLFLFYGMIFNDTKFYYILDILGFIMYLLPPFDTVAYRTIFLATICCHGERRFIGIS